MSKFRFCWNIIIEFLLYFIISINTRRIIKTNFQNVNSTLKRNLLPFHSSNSLEETIDPMDHKIKHLPGLNSNINITQYAGYINIDEMNEGKLFYWFFPAEIKYPESAPLIIWLNGGPGCTSLEGMFLGVGPYYILNGNITLNQFSWHKLSNLLILDQPVGTGFSYIKNNAYPTNGPQVTTHFYTFINTFLHKYNFLIKKKLILKNNKSISYNMTVKIYIFGESYAGRFIPQFSKYMINQNEKLISFLLNNSNNNSIQYYMDIDGIGIGNGWVDPITQYDYSDFAHGNGLITYNQWSYIKTLYKKCEEQLNVNNLYYSSDCTAIIDNIMGGTKLGVANGGKKLNIYDIREYVTDSNSYPFGKEEFVKYLNQKDVQDSLNIPYNGKVKKFIECGDDIFNALLPEDGISTLPEISFLLNNNKRVLFFNGQWDMMCNHISTEKFIFNIEWKDSNKYKLSQRRIYEVKSYDTSPGGYVKEGGGLTSIVIPNSGHSVPYHVPEIAYDMVKNFINNNSFSNGVKGIYGLPDIITNDSYCLELQPLFNNFNTCKNIETPFIETNLKNPKYLTTSYWLWICVVVALTCTAISSILTNFYIHRNIHLYKIPLNTNNNEIENMNHSINHISDCNENEELLYNPSINIQMRKN